MMVERDLANHDPELASKVQVIPGLNLRLAYIDPEAGEDKYYVLQGLKDTTVQGNAKNYYAYERSGGTGTRGQIIVKGPMELPKMTLHLAEIFQDKTGASWGSLLPGSRALPGKYWLQQQAIPDLAASWQYYVNDGVDGKKTGWYPYDSAASDEVEELYAQHVANACEERTSTRLIHSGYFTYKVDLMKMAQQNTRTNKVRTIRRAVGDELKEAPQHLGRSRGRFTTVIAGVLPPANVTLMKPMKRIKVMKVMKKKKPMKAMKVMKKVKKKSKFGSKSEVLKGIKIKTKSGFKQFDLMKNKKGKVVTKRKSAQGLKAFKHIENWVNACKAARIELGLTGFVTMKKGSEFYNKAKVIMERN